MSSLVNIAQAKKASNADIIKTMQKLSDLLTERELNSPNFETSQVFQAILGHQSFNDADDIRVPFIISDSMIAVQSIPPKKKPDGSYKNGKHVIPLIQVPGGKPYYSWMEGTDTFVDSESVSLRGGRAVSLHRVIPGMIVSFHHYVQETGSRERYRIDALKVDYSDDNQLGYHKLNESDALFTMPDIQAMSASLSKGL